ncbi:pimeloyl-ACP methyl ester carboxylesterase [Chryseomicrobium aureum]|uniref:alpha/beta fold hydrolase n=1 Tax=Chryseomicrobium aureum TaxID=1441723 RepID=UPI00195991FF|nr:alpha/beta hydrolase [Chryseomicrobium aureum]MBM7706478.1 pimeloyl-ACP methyl ester carboxylesterase [Chryseomicrobium aureum]
MFQRDTGIAYKEVGTGEAVVFIHGFCGSRSYWSALEAPLKNHMKAYYLDLPGHGESKTVQYSSLEDYVELLKMWKESIGIKKMTLVGHSLGGYLTLAYAEKYPYDLDSYVLIHSTAFPDSDEAKEGRDRGLQIIEKEGLESFIDGLIPKLFDEGFATRHPEILEETKKIGYATDEKQVRRFLKAMRDRKDRRQVINEVDIPHLLVAGETDEVVPSYKTFIGESKKATESLIRGAAHMSMYERPDELAETFIHWYQATRQVTT